MGYVIEISMDIRDPSNYTFIKTHHHQLAMDNNCDSQYFMNEVEGKGKRIISNIIVHVVTFTDDTFETMLTFIRIIRNKKTNHIDCIYRDDDCSCKIIYASSKYLKITDKDFARKFKRENKTKTTTNNQEIAIREALNINK